LGVDSYSEGTLKRNSAAQRTHRSIHHCKEIIMTRTPRTLLALALGAALLLPFAAMADQAYFGSEPDTTPSTLTRAQVIAELAAHDRNAVGADGWRNFEGYSVYVGHPGPGKTRAEVQRELAEFKRNPVGPDGWQSFDGYSVYVGHAKPADTRMATSAVR
jgi:hypothetical protein